MTERTYCTSFWTWSLKHQATFCDTLKPLPWLVFHHRYSTTLQHNRASTVQYICGSITAVWVYWQESPREHVSHKVVGLSMVLCTSPWHFPSRLFCHHSWCEGSSRWPGCLRPSLKCHSPWVPSKRETESGHQHRPGERTRFQVSA